ncbi:MAG: ERF family protein [Cypionkella sp.]|nr:ERF family protein [Cypionkella sp.]
MKEAYAALAKAQTEMGKALKNASNPHMKSKYADLGSVMDACLPALHRNGFAVFQPCGADERGPFVETIFAHTGGDLISSRVYLIIGKSDMQGLGLPSPMPAVMGF